MRFKPFSEWGLPLSDRGLMLIAGPCAAESEAQVLETARDVKACGVSLFRAGVWKPRTRPGTFEGIGEKAFEWLVKARSETGLRFAVEIANGRHVKTALEHGADVLWVGARTTVTPFAVQEIADALRGTDIPVLVKNPVNPDLELWTGAIERLANAGLTRLAAVLRGVSGLEAGHYRNAPDWPLALALKQRFPTLPFICDPSHIAGDTKYIREISQQALNLDFEGLMVETHFDPENAMSDKHQQLTPQQLSELLAELVVKCHDDTASEGVQKALAACRCEIDQADMTLLATLARRMEMSRRIGELKKSANLTVLQSTRWEQVLGHAIEHGRSIGLSEEFVRDIFNRIHIESITQQQ